LIRRPSPFGLGVRLAKASKYAVNSATELLVWAGMATTQSDIRATAPAGLSDSLRPRAAGEGFAPEFLLTAACCRWPPSPARNAAVSAASAGIVDWDEFLRLVNHQRVGVLAYGALTSAGIELPAAVAAALAALAKRIAWQNVSFAAETVRLQRLFAAAEIPVLVLKGVALAQLAYGSLELKHARDIDLLVPPDRAAAALQLLERDGYSLSAPVKRLSDAQRRALICYAREAELVHSDRQLRLELQWRAADNPLLLKGVDAAAPSQSIALGGGLRIRTLARDDLFAYLCVHGAHHGWSRLKWLADVNALIAANDADIVGLYRHAQRIGAGLCAGQTLLLCQRLLGLPLPADLGDEISRNRRVQRLATIVLAAMTAPHTETELDGGVARVARSVYTQFLLGEGWPFYAAQLRAASVTAVDVVLVPLPPALHFLYPLLRLPLWLWRRAVAAGRRSG
jgi:Uncharacterised nucleotidyltransferase